VIATRQHTPYGGDWGLALPLPWQLRLAQVMVGLEAWTVPLVGVALALPKIVAATAGSRWGSVDVIEEWPSAALFLLATCAAMDELIVAMEMPRVVLERATHL
jgi:hypothetical protein